MSERRPVVGYEGLYEVSDDGDVFRVGKGMGSVVGRKLTPFVNDNYSKVNLYKDRGMKNQRISRLVAMAFLPNQDQLPEVNHKDGNKQNNHVSNLEWCDRTHNERHSFQELGKKTSFTPRRVKGTHINSGVMIFMPSMTEAARFVGGAQNKVAAVCRGENKSHRGWRFEFL